MEICAQAIHGVGGRHCRPDASGLNQNDTDRASDAKLDAVSGKDAVTKLLKEIESANRESKGPLAQKLSDDLHNLKQAFAEGEFDKLLEQLIQEIQRWLELINSLFPDLPAPSPSLGGGGGGGGGGGSRVNPRDFGFVEAMKTKGFTEGADYHDYKVDKSHRGKAPGTGREEGNIWSGFRQGPDGNCTTVSAIKSAMMKFGQKPTDIFKEVTAVGTGFDVEMRDGFKLHLTKDNLKEAAEQARFKGDNKAMITDANFLYAASAMRAHMEGNQGYGHGNDHNAKRSFKDALQSLNDGEHADESLNRLGLKGLYRQSSSSELAGGKVVGVVNYGGHSMAVIGGHVELWGGKGGAPRQAERDPFRGGQQAYAFI